jgi:hypothetical protein
LSAHWPHAAQLPLATNVADVIMDAQFVTKQRHRRSQLPVLTYALIPTLLANPTIILDQGNRRIILLLRSGDVWSVAVKTTSDRRENYLLSFRNRTVRTSGGCYAGTGSCSATRATWPD